MNGYQSAPADSIHQRRGGTRPDVINMGMSPGKLEVPGKLPKHRRKSEERKGEWMDGS